jgi:hypothetical protein
MTTIQIAIDEVEAIMCEIERRGLNSEDPVDWALMDACQAVKVALRVRKTHGVTRVGTFEFQPVMEFAQGDGKGEV